MIIGLILARGGSKRLPGKNLLHVGHETLVARAIGCARQCAEIDTVILSTDSEDIALEGWKHGALVLRRPEQLAGDMATSEVGIVHAAIAAGAKPTDTVVLLQPTSPLRTPEDVNAALRMFARGAGPSIVSVGEDGELNGAVYVTRLATLAAHRTFQVPGTAHMMMPSERSIDIDTREDLERAQLNWDG
jgi:CMP-N-acetylneuraminic acid synthetase